MFTYCFRIALQSEMHNERLKKLYGKNYVINVKELKQCLELMSVCKNVLYSLVIHDRDIGKAHLHLVVCFNDYNVLNILQNTFFPVGYMDKCNSFDACLLYLLHRGHADKVQYDVDELFTNIDYYDRFPFLNKEAM